ncbi:uncharacterized protein LOC120661633 [Panicum virgatum]|uniref:uncharacterized protein LOC120661633 n=1 Tax=Panicum virgatum TaxID=38727 RepID=UPI0019D560E2|nr:uncharacterized protein LOC120661633 [Panicum virgatum]
MNVISESDPNGSSSEDKASNTNSKGGTSNGNADASHSDSGDSHLSPPSKLKKCSKFSSQFNIAKMVKLIGRLTGPKKRYSYKLWVWFNPLPQMYINPKCTGLMDCQAL